jgi:hypothetical protein
MWTFSTAVAIAGVLATVAPSLAQQAREKTYVSFSNPVRIPGAVLPAGDYTFRLAEPLQDQQLVNIFKRGSHEKVASVMTVPVRRDRRQDQQVVLFRAAAGQVPAVKAWFYPTNETGHLFVYSRAEAQEISRDAVDTVLGADLPDNWDSPVILNVLEFDASGHSRPYSADTRETTAKSGSDSTRGDIEAGPERSQQRREAAKHLDKAKALLNQVADHDNSDVSSAEVQELQNKLDALRTAWTVPMGSAPQNLPDRHDWRQMYSLVRADLNRMINDRADNNQDQPVGTSGSAGAPNQPRSSQASTAGSTLREVRDELMRFHEIASGKAWPDRDKR